MLPTISDINTDALKQLLEVYVNNFIGLFQPCKTSPHYPSHPTCHPPHLSPSTTSEAQDELEALKKLKQGYRLWSTCKEILGWLFDGITRTITLPNEKVTSLTRTYDP